MSVRPGPPQRSAPKRPEAPSRSAPSRPSSASVTNGPSLIETNPGASSTGAGTALSSPLGPNSSPSITPVSNLSTSTSQSPLPSPKKITPIWVVETAELRIRGETVASPTRNGSSSISLTPMTSPPRGSLDEDKSLTRSPQSSPRNSSVQSPSQTKSIGLTRSPNSSPRNSGAQTPTLSVTRSISNSVTGRPASGSRCEPPSRAPPKPGPSTNSSPSVSPSTAPTTFLIPSSTVEPVLVTVEAPVAIIQNFSPESTPTLSNRSISIKSASTPLSSVSTSPEKPVFPPTKSVSSLSPVAGDKQQPFPPPQPHPPISDKQPSQASHPPSSVPVTPVPPSLDSKQQSLPPSHPPTLVSTPTLIPTPPPDKQPFFPPSHPPSNSIPTPPIDKQPFPPAHSPVLTSSTLPPSHSTSEIRSPASPSETKSTPEKPKFTKANSVPSPKDDPCPSPPESDDPTVTPPPPDSVPPPDWAQDIPPPPPDWDPERDDSSSSESDNDDDENDVSDVEGVVKDDSDTVASPLRELRTIVEEAAPVQEPIRKGTRINEKKNMVAEVLTKQAGSGIGLRKDDIRTEDSQAKPFSYEIKAPKSIELDMEEEDDGFDRSESTISNFTTISEDEGRGRLASKHARKKATPELPKEVLTPDKIIVRLKLPPSERRLHHTRECMFVCPEAITVIEFKKDFLMDKLVALRGFVSGHSRASVGQQTMQPPALDDIIISASYHGRPLSDDTSLLALSFGGRESVLGAPVDVDSSFNGVQTITLVMKRRVADAGSLRKQMIRISAPELKTFFTVRADETTTILQLKEMIRLKLKQKGFRRRFLPPQEAPTVESFAILDKIAGIEMEEEEDDVGPLPVMVPNVLVKSNFPKPPKNPTRRSILVRSEEPEIPGGGAYWIRPYSQKECLICRNNAGKAPTPTFPLGNLHFHALTLPEIKAAETDKNLGVQELNLCLEHPQRSKPYLRGEQIAFNCFRSLTERDNLRGSREVMTMYLTIPEDIG